MTNTIPSHDELHELVYSARSSDPRIRNAGYVKLLAIFDKTITNSALRHYVDLDEARSIAAEKLIDVVERFDPARGQFSHLFGKALRMALLTIRKSKQYQQNKKTGLYFDVVADTNGHSLGEILASDGRRRAVDHVAVVDDRDMVRAAWKALRGTLSELERWVFKTVFWQRYSFEEAAGIITTKMREPVNRKAVDNTICRIRAKLDSQQMSALFFETKKDMLVVPAQQAKAISLGWGIEFCNKSWRLILSRGGGHYPSVCRRDVYDAVCGVLEAAGEALHSRQVISAVAASCGPTVADHVMLALRFLYECAILERVGVSYRGKDVVARGAAAWDQVLQKQQ